MRLKNSFLIFPGIGSKTEKKLWKNNITLWSEALESDVLSDRRKSKIEEEYEKAEKNLEVGNTLFFGKRLPSGEIWRAYEDFQDKTAFFDIETTGLDKKKDEITTVSIYRNGEAKTLVKGQDLTKDRLKQELHESKLLVSFNGKRFDQPFLENSFNMDIQVPHLDLMYTCKKLGYTGGLKKIEKEMGISREQEDIDGREAIRLWKQYQRNNDKSSLETLIQYNQADTVNLEKLLSKAHNQLEQQRFRSFLPE